jgi:hypothetical protein
VEHRVQQNIAARSDIGGLGIFNFVVADAIFAGDENHPTGGQARRVDGIVPSA